MIKKLLDNSTQIVEHTEKALENFSLLQNIEAKVRDKSRFLFCKVIHQYIFIN